LAFLLAHRALEPADFVVAPRRKALSARFSSVRRARDTVFNCSLRSLRIAL
jgi:hypothetical protein